MDLLKVKINELKKIIQKRADQDKVFRKNFKEALAEVFGEIKILEFIKDFYFKSEKIFVQTQNKTFANELFLKKELILKIFNSKNKMAKAKDMIAK